MSKIEENMEEKKEKREYKDDLDYLVHSLIFIKNSHQEAVDVLRKLKEHQQMLQEDMKKIQTPQLQQACAQIHNSIVMQQKEVRLRIKESLVDLRYVSSIYKKIKKIG